MFSRTSFYKYKVIAVLKEGWYVFLGQISVIIASIFLVSVVTRLVTPDEYGKLAIGLTIANFTNQLFFGPLSNGVTRFYIPAKLSGELNNYFYATYKLSIKATLSILCILIGGLIICLFFYYSFLYVFLCSIIFSIFSGYNGLLFGIQNAQRKRRLAAFYQGVEPWLKLLLSFLLLSYFGNSGQVGMFSYMLSSFLLFIPLFYFFKKHNLQDCETTQYKSYYEKIWNFSIPFSIFGIFTFLHISSDRWALQYFSSFKEVGLFAVLYQISYYPLTILSNFLGQLLTPILYEKSGLNNQKSSIISVNKVIILVSIFLGLLTLFFVAITFIFHNSIIKLIVGVDYHKISYLIPWMILAAGVYSVGQMLSTKFFTQLETHLMTKLKILTSLTGLILNIIGAYFYGIDGIVIAGILFSSLYTVYTIRVIFSKKYFT